MIWQIKDLFGQWIGAPSRAAAEGCLRDGTATEIRCAPDPEARRLALDAALRAIAEQRCERGTPWDDALLEAMAAVRALPVLPLPTRIERNENHEH